METRTGKKTGIWLAFSFALGLHFILLFLPIASQMPVPENSRAPLELQLTTFNPPVIAPVVTEPQPKTPLPEPEPEFSPEPPGIALDEQTRPVPVVNEPAPLTTSLVKRDLQPDLETIRLNSHFFRNNFKDRKLIAIFNT